DYSCQVVDSSDNIIF
nr:immunoglobulin light chain junction region [Macaca mulatta]